MVSDKILAPKVCHGLVFEIMFWLNKMGITLCLKYIKKQDKHKLDVPIFGQVQEMRCG